MVTLAGACATTTSPDDASRSSGTSVAGAASGSTAPGGADPTTPVPTAPLAADGRLVDIGGGRTMYLECTGTGSPTVLLVSGQRAGTTEWHTSTSTATPPAGPVYEAVAATNRVCAYDRPGTVNGDAISRSSPTAQPTTAAAAQADLHAVLDAADEAGPFVVVGHSAGGMVARLYASAHPDDVVGIVLVDPPSEFLQDNLTSEQWPIQEALLEGDITEDLEMYPDIERFDPTASFAELRSSSPLKDMPLVLLSADEPLGPELPGLIASGGVPAGVPPDFGYVFDAANAKAQQQLARIVANAVHITDTHSGHNIHMIQPQLVVGAIDQVLSAVRAP